MPALVSLLLILATPSAARASSAPTGIRGGRAVRHGVSRPLTALAPKPVTKGGTAAAAPPAAKRATAGGGVPDPLLQFDGLSFNDNLPYYEDVSPPPDPSGAAGPNHYVQAINLVYRVVDKDGNPLLGPLPTASIWTGLGGVCETEAAATPQVRYDQLASRWVIAQSAYDVSDASVHECFAVSQTADPTASYQLYDFVLGASAQAGSARLALWPEAYFVTVNQVEGFASAGIGIYAFDRNAMLNGDLPTIVYANAGADLPNTLWGLAGDLDGTNIPAQTTTDVIAALGHPGIDGSPSARIHLWYFGPNFSDPPSSTFTGPVDIDQDDFGVLDCGGPSQGCVPQLGSEQLLQATPSRLMSRMPYRRVGDTESIVAAFTVDAGGGQAAPKWFELRDPLGKSPVLYQQAIYAPDSSHRFVPSVAMNATGGIALAYNKSDATIHPSLAWTGRLPGDPLGVMPEEDVIFEGPNSQPPVVGFWGSYSSLSVDPGDECKLWFTAEYTGDPSPLYERTRVAEFQLTCGETLGGTIEGTVTDSSTGLPIASAQVAVNNGASTTTDPAGHYQVLFVPIGTFEVTASKFGYVPQTATGVVVTQGGDTIQNFTLAPAPQTLLNGTVKDGSGGGWPLYARVTISAPGFGSTTLYTDPVTGYYGISLVAGISYTLSTETVVPGYVPDQRSVLLPASPANAPEVVQQIALNADATACNAPGYAVIANGLSEHFDSGGVPAGWQIVNDGGGAGWTIQDTGDPCGLFPGNDTGGSGAYALVNSHCEGEVLEDTQLITAPVDASALSSVQVRFAQELNGPFPPAGESAEVDVSIDGGATWTNVLHQTASAPGPNSQSVDVTALAAGQPNVRARFHYFNAFAAWWWQVDDVIVGQTSCAAQPGGLVVGNVLDANTGAGLNGATVTNASGLTTHAFPTPDDPAQPDGMYVLFSESGGQTITATQTLYSSESKPVTVVPNAAQRVDFHLDAGSFTASPGRLTVRVDAGGGDVRTLTFDNAGGMPATFGIAELDVPPVPPTPPTAGFADPAMRARALARLTRPELANAPNARGLAPLPGGPPAARPLVAGDVVHAYPTGLDAAWGIALDADLGTLWIGNSFLFAGDDREYQFLTDGTNTGVSIDDSSWIADWAADGAYDPRTERTWRLNVGGDGCVYEMNPDSATVTGHRICPAFATSQRGLAYDPITDTFYSGSWNDGVIQHFDASGTILDSAYVAIPVSGLAFDPSTGRLYALANHDVLLGFDVYVLDTHNHYAVLGAFFVTSGGTPVLSPNGQAGMELGCDGHLWLIDTASQTLYEVDAGATGACDVLDIPWLAENPTAANVPPRTPQDVAVTFDASGLTPGLRQGILRIRTNTPYSVPPVPVDFTVRFADVPDSNLFEAYVYGAAGAGVMPGCDPSAALFCPAAPVTRADMAAFILRAVHGKDFVPAPYAGAFADVGAGDYNADYIQSFSDEGYTAGCGGGNFCPTASHTRAQASVFILKGEHGTSYLPPPCGGIFSDVPCPSLFADWIEQLYAEGVTAGCGAGNFCPSAGIPNGQMAVFLVKAFGIPHL